MIEQFTVKMKQGAYFLYPNGTKTSAKETEVCNRTADGKWYRASFSSPTLPEEFVESFQPVPVNKIRKS